MQEFDLWDVENGEGFVVTEPIEEHPDGLSHAVRVKATSVKHAVMMFRRYSLMPDADITCHPTIDPDFNAAWCEGYKAFNQGEGVNPYRKHRTGSSWDESKQFLGWDDGFHHAPLYRTTDSQQEMPLGECMLNHAKAFVELGFATEFDGSLDSLLPNIIEYGSENQVTPIMVGNLSMERFANLVVKELKPTYKICHTFDIGDLAVYCRYDNLELSAIDLAVYLHFKAEKLIDTAVIISHETTAKYLEIFGERRERTKPSKDAIRLDMYVERESRISDWLSTRFVDLDSQYADITETFIKEQNAQDSSAFVV